MSNTKYFYFVRHGESTANASGIKQGSDSTLTDRGVLQAGLIGQRLKNLPIEIIVSSSMSRAKQTAEVISEMTGHEIIFSDNLVERKSPNDVLGLKIDDPIAVKIMEEIESHYDDQNWRYKDAENWSDLKTRADRALAELAVRPEKHIAVITHGWFLRVLISRMIFGDDINGHQILRMFQVLNTANTGITICRYDDSDKVYPWHVVTWNDHAHLADA